MGASERRVEIIRKLSVRRYDTIYNLANEFGVSERTIRRDILVLSLTEPIYTQSGRYGGGVYMIDNYSFNHLMLSESEFELINNIYNKIKRAKNSQFTDEEILQLQYFIKKHYTPKNRK